ncbi:NADPH-dependent FMN reductase [Polycladidibacter stylochi]|uniref:NADPH-dependent FMN reductase n=1 Tax=Polycladidibacter stylochi TaxID=1807766 RepID=UPI000833147C|nr:NAD(P)H-dependent oxidoreductase [Pseudovibrio stylochi]
MKHPKLAIVTGSTRPGRNAEAVAQWVAGIAKLRRDAQFELIDIADYNLPLLDEPLSALASARMGTGYTKQHTKAWSQTIARFDGYVLVTPEYNFGVPAALKNALDFLHPEWNNKAAGFVGYGTNGGARATAQLRQIMAELQVATTVPEVGLSLLEDFENYTIFKPSDAHLPRLEAMLNQLITWSRAFMHLREVRHD